MFNFFLITIIIRRMMAVRNPDSLKTALKVSTGKCKRHRKRIGAIILQQSNLFDWEKMERIAVKGKRKGTDMLFDYYC